ncbi:MAG: TlpA disulfide reductase family protein, partial [Gammaproteobacteria bacterium]
VYLRRSDQIHRLPFSASHGDTYRFFAKPPASWAALNGTWETTLEFANPERTVRAIATFQQQDADIRGTVRTRSGDYRFLTGIVRDRDLFLSTFDGQGSQLWLATLGEDGVLRGSFDTLTSGQSKWSARRNPDARLEDPATLTWLLPGYERLQFSFPDLDGTKVSLADSQFENKVVLVVIAGSWCPSCHEEVQFMAPLYDEFRDQGLEVVYLMFEYSAVFDEVKEQILAYQKRYDIQHPILFAGDAAKDTRNRALPMLSPIVAFPTTIFIDRSGKVRKIHTAFPGAATGTAHTEYKIETRAYVEKLLHEEIHLEANRSAP